MWPTALRATSGGLTNVRFLEGKWVPEGLERIMAVN
jgi:hypothetical protein